MVEGERVLPWGWSRLLPALVMSIALAPELAPGSEQQLLESAADVAPGSDGLIMLPYLFSERAPYWDAAASGAGPGMSGSGLPPKTSRSTRGPEGPLPEMP